VKAAHQNQGTPSGCKAIIHLVPRKKGKEKNSAIEGREGTRQHVFMWGRSWGWFRGQRGGGGFLRLRKKRRNSDRERGHQFNRESYISEGERNAIPYAMKVIGGGSSRRLNLNLERNALGKGEKDSLAVRQTGGYQTRSNHQEEKMDTLLSMKGEGGKKNHLKMNRKVGSSAMDQSARGRGFSGSEKKKGRGLSPFF